MFFGSKAQHFQVCWTLTSPLNCHLLIPYFWDWQDRIIFAAREKCGNSVFVFFPEQRARHIYETTSRFCKASCTASALLLGMGVASNADLFGGTDGCGCG